MTAFDQRKEAVLTGLEAADAHKPEGSFKPDRSLKQAIDKPLQKTCALINELADFYTTSCCSGRITVFVDDIKEYASIQSPPADLTQSPPSHIASSKKRGYLAFVDHGDSDEAQSAEQRAEGILNKLMQGDMDPHYERTFEKLSNKVKGEDVTRIENAWLRFEPLLLHVKSRSVAAALNLLKACRLAGLKEIGITGGNEAVGFDVRIGGSQRMAVPLIKGGQWKMDMQRVSELVQIADELMQQNQCKIDALNEALSVIA